MTASTLSFHRFLRILPSANKKPVYLADNRPIGGFLCKKRLFSIHIVDVSFNLVRIVAVGLENPAAKHPHGVVVIAVG